jgi:hypothetical protein
MPSKLTPVHCIVFPLLTIAVLDGFTEDERVDLVNTVLALSGDGGMFSLTEEVAMKNFGETLEWFTSMEYKEAIPTSIQCCQTIYNQVTNENTRKSIVNYLIDTANADGKVSDDEKTLVGMFATVILNGIKS